MAFDARDMLANPPAQTQMLASAMSVPLLLAIGTLVVVVLVGGVVLMTVRNRMHKLMRGGDDPGSGTGLGLMEEMRRLRDSGAMSPEEYDRVRANLISQARAETPEPTDSTGNEPGTDEAARSLLERAKFSQRRTRTAGHDRGRIPHPPPDTPRRADTDPKDRPADDSGSGPGAGLDDGIGDP